MPIKKNYYIAVSSQSNETFVFSIKTSVFMKNNASPHLSRQTEKTCLIFSFLKKIKIKKNLNAIIEKIC